MVRNRSLRQRMNDELRPSVDIPRDEAVPGSSSGRELRSPRRTIPSSIDQVRSLYPRQRTPLYNEVEYEVGGIFRRGSLRRPHRSVRSSNVPQNGCFYQEVILLKYSSTENTLTGVAKSYAYRHNRVRITKMMKNWDNKAVMDHFRSLFPRFLQNDNIQLKVMYPSSKDLVEPPLSSPHELTGELIKTLYKMKTVYLRPSENLNEEMNEDMESTSESADNFPCCSSVRDSPLDSPRDSPLYCDELPDEDLEAVFQQQTEIALAESTRIVSDTTPGTLVGILNKLKQRIHVARTNYFNIYRADVLKCCFRAMGRKRFHIFNTLDVIFTDGENKSEGAVDLGGPTREMLSIALHQLKESRIFEGEENCKFLRLSNEALEL